MNFPNNFNLLRFLWVFNNLTAHFLEQVRRWRGIDSDLGL
jgi:hypothetical protein